MSEPISVVTLSSALEPDAGATYWTWAISATEAEQIRALLDRPADVERYQTAAELEASNQLVDSFETPPLEAP